MCSTLFCFASALSTPCLKIHILLKQAYDRALEDVKDKYFKPYILAAGDYAGCLFMTLPPLPPIPSYMFPPHPTSTSLSLLPTSLPSSHAPSSPVSCPHPPLSNPFIPSTFLLLPCAPRPFVPRPSPSSSSRLPPPPCFSPFFLFLLSPSHHFFSPCFSPLPPSPHT